jgi:type I restriction enzyme M protein
MLDFISGTGDLKDTPKEQVRQRIARALFHEYGISVEDMEGDYPVSVAGRRRRVDIAIFRPGQPHERQNLRRVVVCRPEPTQAKRGAVKMRDYAQAAKDIEEIKPYFEEIDSCQYGLWTNGLEFFFLAKKVTKFQVDTEPIGLVDRPGPSGCTRTREDHSPSEGRVRGGWLDIGSRSVAGIAAIGYCG